jgi:hypothetical protein
MESIFNDIVAMGVEQGPVLFQMTAKVAVQELRKGKTCKGNVCKGKELKAMNVRAMHVREIPVMVSHARVMHVMVWCLRVRHVGGVHVWADMPVQGIIGQCTRGR